MLRRRDWLGAGAALALPLGPLTLSAATPAATPAAAPAAESDPQEQVARALRTPAGHVLLFRHALAPGTFDPPQFKLDDCSTQRNLNEGGREQARRMGRWFSSRQLRPARVRSSPWCRCLDTGRLAFGDATQAWAALGSPRAGTEEVNAQAVQQLQQALREVMQQAAGFEAWISHNFVFQAWLGQSVDSGEGLLLGLDAAGAPQVLGRLRTPA